MKAKYVKTINALGPHIIVFSEILPHNTFKDLSPVSAGFITFFLNDEGQMTCQCYGQSDGLGLVSDPEDTRLTKQQILNQF